MKNLKKIKSLLILTSVILSVFSGNINLVYSSETKPKYGPKGNPKAEPLWLNHDYFKKNKAPDFWALIGHYVPQFNDYSCSAASMAIVLNGALVKSNKTSETKNVLQTELIEKVTTHHWKARLSDAGDKGAHGTSLDVLRDIAENAFKIYGFSKVKVTAIHVNEVNEKSLNEFRKYLIQNEKDEHSFIVINYLQNAATDDADAGHISPIAAYDEKNKKTLVLDTDRTYYEPYWVKDEDILKGMSGKDSESKISRGYLVIEGL